MPSREVARITLIVALVLVAAGFAVALIYSIRHVLLLVGLAAFLAVALEPAVTAIQRFIRSRPMAVGVMALIMVFVISLFVAAVVPPMTKQVRNLIDKLPSYGEQLKDRSTRLGQLEERFHITKRLGETADRASAAMSDIGKVFGTVAGVLTDFLVILALTLYFLANAPRLKAEGLRLVPAGRRKRTAAILEQVFGKVGGWMEGNLLISVIAGTLSFGFLLAAGIPYPAALAMWVAITDMIPAVGALLGAMVCVIVAFFAGVPQGIAAIVFFLIYQQIENYVISPRVMKRTVDISAVAVIVAALVGGTLLGVIGVLLAVPAAASLKVIGSELWLTDKTG
jgi:predicted PurR-regulated permease PerM